MIYIKRISVVIIILLLFSMMLIFIVININITMNFNTKDYCIQFALTTDFLGTRIVPTHLVEFSATVIIIGVIAADQQGQHK